MLGHFSDRLWGVEAIDDGSVFDNGEGRFRYLWRWRFLHRHLLLSFGVWSGLRFGLLRILLVFDRFDPETCDEREGKVDDDAAQFFDVGDPFFHAHDGGVSNPLVCERAVARVNTRETTAGIGRFAPACVVRPSKTSRAARRTDGRRIVNSLSVEKPSCIL